MSDEKPAILKLHDDHIQDIQFSSHVVGSTFYPHAQEIIKLLKRVPSNQIILRFKPEPDNEFDPYAVAIFVSIQNAKKEYMIGHFPKEGSSLIFYVLTHDKDYQMKVTNIYASGGDKQRDLCGLFFDFNIYKL